MSSPFIWIVLPGMVALILVFLHRYQVISSILAITLSLTLAGLAWMLEIGEVITIGSWAFIIQEQMTILGRSFVISNLVLPQIAIFYLSFTFWIVGALVIPKPPFFTSLSLASVAVLISALSVQPILFAALLLEVAVLIFVLMLTPMGQSVNRGTLRFLTYQTLGLPFILLAGWFLSGIELQAGNTQEIVRAAVFLGLGFSFHLGIFPLHSWIPMLTETAHPYVTSFVITTLLSIGILFPVGFMQRYPSLNENINLLEIIRLIGVLMVLVGGIWATFQRNLGRVLGFAMIVEIGRTFLAISIPDGDKLLFGLLFPRVISFGVWALCLTKLRAHVEDLKFHTVQGYGRRYWIAGIGIVAANFSLVGIPILAGFPIYSILWERLAVNGFWISLAAIAGSAGLMVGGIRALAVLVMGPDELELEEEQEESFFSNMLILMGVSVLFLMGLFPQWFLPALTSISANFGAPAP
ncbi:MAG: hypothetical protein ISR58_12655 [Anaerolineales bacterium]|nr:hypothetical protein [Chloroflexota bacterium]MBL6982029.1 hypothetical protein [Anaerolineales bacterium]